MHPLIIHINHNRHYDNSYYYIYCDIDAHDNTNHDMGENGQDHDINDEN